MANDRGLDHYTKGDVIIHDTDPLKLFENLPSNIINVKVKAGCKMRNILGFAIRMFKDKENRHILFIGSQDAIYKTISCVEIMKRKHQHLHQITKTSTQIVEEFWEPKDAELDRIKVTREIPQIHIWLSKDPLNTDEPGYQAPGKVNFWSTTENKKRKWKK